ncbi:MAG: pyrroloquinoline quinone-dependent dehydrogenase [Acidobacteria bacterium]|nr:MAG: pyrroloquinoline quinone-dependent dehydrogenase [Acidobacteriota bacterium]
MIFSLLQQKSQGWDMIKIFPGLTRAEYDAIMTTARRIGMRTGGHVPTDVGVEHALETGQEILAVCRHTSANNHPRDGLDRINPVRLSGVRNRSCRFSRLCLLLFASCVLSASLSGQTITDTNWPYYGGDAGGMRYSHLTQVNPENVSKLKIAWVFHTGDVSDGKHGKQRSGFEATPILVDGIVFFTTGFNRVIAINPETGKQQWAFDPKIDPTWDYGDALVNRGVATWLDAARSVETGRACRRRVYEATLDARLIALDAATGMPCADFGDRGEISLRNVPRYMPGRYHMTSPPAVIDDLVIVGSAINDNNRVDMPSGVVRAFDARTGALRWSWDPIQNNNPATTGSTGAARTWQTGAGNAWSVMSMDAEHDLVFIPTGSASPDYYGGMRPGDDRWADSVIALRGKTGEFVWGFQLVHHDLWDYDTASPPLLATLRRAGKNVPVVVQGNKTGFLYVLNRETGVPVFPVEERPVPQSDVPGELTSPTQPFPTAPPPLVPQKFSVDAVWGTIPLDHENCANWIRSFRNEGIFTPPSLQGTLVIPGNIGGMTWSGYAFDPERNLLVVPTNNIASVAKLIPREKLESAAQSGEDGEYAQQTGAPYGMYRRFLQGSSGLPCTPPPWGTLSGVDMNQGTIKWRVPLGSMEYFGGGHDSVPPGSIGFGGPIVTASGLVFIAGTFDPYIRAFDVETGKELWKAQLPASGNATPMTYSVNGKQYLVIAAGGHPKITEEALSDSLVAFALP